MSLCSKSFRVIFVSRYFKWRSVVFILRVTRTRVCTTTAQATTTPRSSCRVDSTKRIVAYQVSNNQNLVHQTANGGFRKQGVICLIHTKSQLKRFNIKIHIHDKKKTTSIPIFRFDCAVCIDPVHPLVPKHVDEMLAHRVQGKPAQTNHHQTGKSYCTGAVVDHGTFVVTSQTALIPPSDECVSALLIKGRRAIDDNRCWLADGMNWTKKLNEE